MNIFKMKEQDKTPEKQLGGDSQSTRKRIQSNDGEDDLISQKKNGGKDWEDTQMHGS